MKVICISKDTPEQDDPQLIVAAALLTVGDTYTVIEQGDDWYELEEFPGNMMHQICWRKKHFMPLSDVDETEFERNYKIKIYENRTQIQTPNRGIRRMPVDAGNNFSSDSHINDVLRYYKNWMPE